MRLSVVVLYHPALWNLSYSYRVLLIFVRSMELLVVSLRFLLIRGPLLIVWTRLPGLRGARSPYGQLGLLLAPVEHRAGLLIGDPTAGLLALAQIQDTQDAAGVKMRVRALAERRRSMAKVILGGMVRGLLTELGPVFLKLGQILSMRPECPPFLREELQLLQDRLPPLGENNIRKVIERELAAPVEDVFDWLDGKPLSTASLAQVHAGRLKTGEEVALKVQRPYLEGTVALDSAIVVHILIRLVRTLFPMFNKTTDVTLFTSSFRSSLRRETDFFLEGRSQEKIHALVLSHPVYSKVFKIADVYWDYTTSKLLTMELVKSYHRIDALMDLPPEQIFEVLQVKFPEYSDDVPVHLWWAAGAFWMDMSLWWGVCHGDPHLGNLYLLEPQDGQESWRMFVCDFGMVQELEGEELEGVRDFVLNLMYHGDADKLVQAAIALHERAGGDPRKLDVEKLRDDMRISLERRLIAKPGGEFSLPSKLWGTSTVGAEVMYRLYNCGIRLPESFWLVFKSMLYMEELGQTLYALDYAPFLVPLGVKISKQRVLEELRTRDMSNIRGHLDEIAAPLRRRERAWFRNCLERIASGERDGCSEIGTEILLKEMNK